MSDKVKLHLQPLDDQIFLYMSEVWLVRGGMLRKKMSRGKV